MSSSILMCPACIVCAQSGHESQEESVPVLRFYFQYTRKSTDEISKVDSTGLFIFFVQVRANKYRYLSWSIDRSDSEVDDGLHEGAAPHMEEGPSIAHCWPRDQVTHAPVWSQAADRQRMRPVLTSRAASPVTRSGRLPSRLRP